MRLRSQLTAAVSVAIVMVMGLAAATWVVAGRSADIADAQDTVHAVRDRVSNLLALTHEFAAYSEARSQRQWRTNFAAFVQLLDDSGKATVALPVDLLPQVRALAALFQQMVDARASPGELGPRQIHLLVDQLTTAVQGVSESTDQWAGELTNSHRRTERHYYMLASSVPLLVLLILLLMAAMLIRRILRPLSKLHRAVQAVARGDVTVRSATGTNDEFGELSRHFDAMALDLVSSLRQEIVERKQAERQLGKLSLAIEQSPHSIVITDVQACIEYVNAAFVTVSGYAREDVIGQNSRILQSGKTPSPTYGEMWETLSKGQVWRGEFSNRDKNGREYDEFAIISPLRQSDGRVSHYVAVKEDLTQRKAAEAQIQSLAFSDLLTGLANRRMLIVRLQQMMIASERNKRQGALLLVDLDNFKDLNDALGHEQGDQLLQQFAARLGASVAQADTVARLGGDEFVILLEQLDRNPLEAAMQAETTGHRILDALRQPCRLGSAEVSCTASIGITLVGERHEDTAEPLKRAELAMYQAKAHGRNTLRFFDPQMQTAVSARVALEAGLREAIEKEQFLLHYQAQVTDQGRIFGVEVLLRWQDPKRGMVSPAEFIALAEETGLILPIGSWVLETACKQLAQWATTPAMAQLTLAVNVSARQFHQRDFVDQVLSTLQRTGANASRLKLELTESVLVTDVEGVIAKMSALKGKGVTFSLDDFGTGYSSLSYLKRLPLDQLKIDQGFVRDILIDPNDAAIASMVVALAASMGLTVIAEGVETAAQRDFLAGLGCRAYQGYLFSRSLSLQDFEPFVTGAT
ncbi:MAG: EAL domain-containing protein [Rhodoferax sp.]